MNDFRVAVRSLKAAPLVTAAAILSLALGIGANTAIFSLVNGLLLRPLPVRDPQKLVVVSTGHGDLESFNYLMFDRIRQLNQFDGVLAWSLPGPATLTDASETQPVERFYVSGDYFSTLGVQAIRGRTLASQDDVAGGGPSGLVAVMSYRYWQTRFGGSPDIVGARMVIDRTPVTIIGVTPPEFFGLMVGRSFEIALPIRGQPLVQPGTPLTDDLFWLRIGLRLKLDQPVDAATNVLRAAQPAIRVAALPRGGQEAQSFLKDPFSLVPLASTVSPLRRRFQQPLVALLAVVGLVLCIACANIANLMLARGAARRHELSVRQALGASSWRLVRQVLAESLLLASLGGVGAIALGRWASRAIIGALSTASTPVFLDVSLDWRIFAFAALSVAGTAAVSAVAPAVRASQIHPIDALKEHGRSATRHARGVVSNVLIVAQVAMSLVLIVAAGLLVRTFEHLSSASLGFDRDPVIVTTVQAPTTAAADRNVLYHRLVRAVSTMPGVAAAGGSFNPPIVGAMVGEFVVSEPGTDAAPGAEHISQSADITPGWFSAYGTPIREGREFDERDLPSTPPVMIVNEAFVQRFVPDGRAVGKALSVTFRTPPFGDARLGTKTIVGIVGDSAYRTIRDPRRPTLYFPIAQRTDPLLFTNFYIAVRSSGGSPAALTRELTTTLKSVNPDLTLTFRTLTDQVNDSIAQDRVIAALSSFFGVLAMLLAAVGLYGVTSYAVAQRRTEIGIRMALGAKPVAVVRLVVWRVGVLVLAGVIAGLSIWEWASRFIQSLVYGLEARDPINLAGAALMLAAIGGIAAGLPAWRASRIDPAEVLRSS